MNSNKAILSDDKIEVAGKWPSTAGTSAARHRKKVLSYLITGIAAVAVVAAAWLLFGRKGKAPEAESGVFDPLPSTTTETTPPDLLGTPDAADTFTEKLDTVINDVLLSIYIPHNSTPVLSIGVPDISDSAITLAAQAADVRSDNGKILGAFVLAGEPKAWGLSKKGYCAIIDGVVSVGVSDNSPLFEEATEKGGYFFRQYPLVDNGRLVDNEPKNKTMRKALCSRGGQILMVVSESDESFHDFAQALVDLEVDNAIYLVGSHTSYGWYRSEDGAVTEFAPRTSKVFKNETYIVWKAQNNHL